MMEFMGAKYCIEEHLISLLEASNLRQDMEESIP